MSRPRPRGAAFQVRLVLWLLGVQGLLWLAVLPWNFAGTVQLLKQLQNPSLESNIQRTWDAAKDLQAGHPEILTAADGKALTTALEGVRRDYQAGKSLQADVAVRGFRDLLFLAFWQLAGVALTAFLASRILSRQVRQVHHAVVGLRQGNRTARLPALRGREFQALGTEFNRLLDSLQEHEQRLSELGKLIGWQETARFLSHQIKNPLTSLTLAANNLQRLGALQSPQAVQNAEILTEESGRLLTLVNRLKELTGFGPLDVQPLDLAVLVAEVATRPFAAPVTLVWNGPPRWMVQGDRFLLEQVFANLIANSAEASAGAVEVTVTAAADSLEVHDSLSGLPDDLPAKLFRPPFTTKASGTGLGLWFCRRILQLHGGGLTADLTPQKGLRFHLTFGEVGDGQNPGS